MFVTRLQVREVGTPDPCPDFRNSDCAVTIHRGEVGGRPVFEGPVKIMARSLLK